MDLYRFNYHNYAKRVALVWEHGTFIDFRDVGDNRIILYDMGRFFAEIWFDSDMNEVILVRGFRSIQCLEPYLETIKLNIS
jgi:hypothetical protein